jgi:outer membrane immunogenic protein
MSGPPRANTGDDLMKTKLLSAMAFVAALPVVMSAPVSAADMRAPVKAPLPAPVYAYNWTGFYIGGHIGGAWSERCFEGTLGIVGKACNDKSGWLGGGQVGFNIQTGQFVFGVEFSGSWSDLGGGNTTGTLPAGWWASSDGKSLLLLTGRVGYAFDRALIYVTGGGAWARNSVDLSNGVAVISHDFDRQGWTIGAGFEYALSPNWSLAGQYNFVDLGSKSVAFAAPLNVTGSVSQDVHVATLRLNYRFGWGAPVTARY